MMRGGEKGRGARKARPPARTRLAALEARIRELEARLARLEGGEVRRLRAAPFDGRARALPPEPGPTCIGCRLPATEPSDRCVFCGLVFSALPRHLRPHPEAKPAGRRRARRGGARAPQSA